MLSRFDYFRPDNLQDALEYLNNNAGTNILAGGSDIMLELRSNKIDV